MKTLLSQQMCKQSLSLVNEKICYFTFNNMSFECNSNFVYTYVDVLKRIFLRLNYHDNELTNMFIINKWYEEYFCNPGDPDYKVSVFYYIDKDWIEIE